MHQRRLLRRLAAAFLAMVLLTGLIVPASAANWNMTYFLRKYSDWHFDLSKSPNNPMTYEEYIAIAYAYSYYGDGTTATPAADSTGKAPSAWAARYVQAEVAKRTITPSEVNYTANVTLADVAQFLARAKGKYAYDYNNVYSFTGTSGLSAEDKMYLNVAVDHNLIPYTPGMNVSQTVARKDAQKYLVPEGTLTCKAAASSAVPSMKEMHAYFENEYWDFAKAEKTLDYLKAAGDDISMVTLACAYTRSKNPSGVWVDAADVANTAALAGSQNRGYAHSPNLDAIDYCHDTGKLILLGISNADNNGFDKTKPHEMLSSTASMDQAISEIMDSVNTYDFDGVNLGFEHLYDADRSGFATFITRLGSALHKQGKVLMTTVGAYHSAALESASCYDYNSIGKASDYVHIILYDDYPDTAYTYTKQLGAMSNYVRIGRCLRYASNAMDPSKIILGMSTMTTDYNTTKITGKDTPFTDAEALRVQHGASLVWDSDTAGAHFNYTDDTGNHIVYLESTTGLQMRAKLAYSYGVGGVSFYHIGSGYTQAYPAVSSQSSYKPEIMSAISTGLVPNSLRGSYNAPITRAEFCKLIAAFLEQYYGKTLDEIVSDKGSASVSFTDTRDEDVLNIAALGIVTGMGEGKFAPNNSISRQQAATMLARLADVVGCKTNASEVSFTDASAIASWAQDGVGFISACQDPTNSKRVMGGTGSGRFSPKGSYTREQSIMTLIRLFHAAE